MDRCSSLRGTLSFSYARALSALRHGRFTLSLSIPHTPCSLGWKCPAILLIACGPCVRSYRITPTTVAFVHQHCNVIFAVSSVLFIHKLKLCQSHVDLSLIQFYVFIICFKKYNLICIFVFVFIYRCIKNTQNIAVHLNIYLFTYFTSLQKF